LRLTDSLQSEIFSYLGVRDIYLHVARSCKGFNALTNDEHELKRHLSTLELHFPWSDPKQRPDELTFEDIHLAFMDTTSVAPRGTTSVAPRGKHFLTLTDDELMPINDKWFPGSDPAFAARTNDSADSLYLFLSQRHQQTAGRFRLQHLNWTPRHTEKLVLQYFRKPREGAALDPIYPPLQFLLRFLRSASGHAWFPANIQLDWGQANYLTFESDRVAALLAIADVQAVNVRESVAALWSVTDNTFGWFLQNFSEAEKLRMMQVRESFPPDTPFEQRRDEIYPTLVLNDFTIRIDFSTKFVARLHNCRQLNYVRYKIHSNANGRRICVCEWSDRVTKSRIAGPRKCSECRMPVSTSDSMAVF
jgi:hypothetical protein